MNMSRRLIILLLLAGSTLMTATAQTSIYKWIDKSGNTVYSQLPPETGSYESIQTSSVPPANTTGNTGVGNTNGAIQAGETNARKNAKVEKLTQDNEAIRAQKCKGAKQNLQVYQIYRRIKQKNGTVVRLNDQERQKKIAEMKQAIKEFCY